MSTIAFQDLLLVMGTVFILAGLMFRGVIVVAMRRSSYDRFSYLATWIVVSPVLFIGIVLLWFGAVSIALR